MLHWVIVLLAFTLDAFIRFFATARLVRSNDDEIIFLDVGFNQFSDCIS